MSAAAESAALCTEMQSIVATATGRSVQIARAQPLAGGASMQTWAVDLSLDGEPQSLILRRDMESTMFAGALSRAQEFRLLELAHSHGVMAPKPRWLNTEGRAWFLMDRLPGESVGRRVVKLPELASARPRLASQMGEQLARIHALPIDDVPDLPRPGPGSTGAAMALAMIRDAMDSLARDNPLWEFAHRWLTLRVPAPSGPPTVLHGDFRIGNLLVTPEGLSGVLDWEFAHVGDPLDDLAWPLVRDWRFENDALVVGGVGNLDDYLAAYQRAGGRSVDRDALGWWEIVGNLRWAVFCHSQAERHLSGRDRSVEFASLGRKAAEVEWEVLNLIRRSMEGPR